MSTVQVRTELPFDELLKAVQQLGLPDLEQLMSQLLALQAQRRDSSLPEVETELLLKINQGLPRDVQERFDELVVKRRGEVLTHDEHEELLRLTDQIERADARRAKYMAELARLRGISLRALMEDLGIRPPAHVCTAHHCPAKTDRGGTRASLLRVLP